MPYDLAPRLFPKDLPPPASKEVEAILEVDRLFWLDPRNAQRKQFERRLVPGEELPYELPTGTTEKGIPLVDVLVTRQGRTFLVKGKPRLIIVDYPDPKVNRKKIAKKEQKDYGIKNTLQEFRKFMAEYARQVVGVRRGSMENKPSADDRAAQSSRDKQRAQERRESRAAARAALIESKRQHGKVSRQRADLSVPDFTRHG